eukprot:6548529-Pyramimonas_sp.AAC.2
MQLTPLALVVPYTRSIRPAADCLSVPALSRPRERFPRWMIGGSIVTVGCPVGGRSLDTIIAALVSMSPGGVPAQERVNSRQWRVNSLCERVNSQSGSLPAEVGKLSSLRERVNSLRERVNSLWERVNSQLGSLPAE